MLATHRIQKKINEHVIHTKKHKTKKTDKYTSEAIFNTSLGNKAQKHTITNQMWIKCR